MTTLVRSGDDGLRGREVVEGAPGIARLDAIDAPAPCVEWDVLWRLRLRCFRERKNVGGDAMTELSKTRLDLIEHLRRQAPAQPGAEERVVVVLVAEARGVLKEFGQRDLLDT